MPKDATICSAPSMICTCDYRYSIRNRLKGVGKLRIECLWRHSRRAGGRHAAAGSVELRAAGEASASKLSTAPELDDLGEALDIVQ